MRAWAIVAITIAVVIMLGGAFGFSYVKSTGLRAKAHPGKFETYIAGRALELAYPAGVKDMRNPVQATSDVLSAARDHFARDCAVCHANDGSGKSETGSGLYPPPPDLRDESDMTDGELFYIIQNGIRFTGMPGWSFPDEKIWGLVGFIRTLPKLSPADLDAMNAINHLGTEHHEPSHHEHD
jgi:mono/diheme cytochrome c family protein